MADDKRLPVVVVHGVGSGSNKDRAGFSKNLSNAVHEVSRPVTRVGEHEPIKNAEGPAPNNGIYWEEALWENENQTAEQAINALTSLANLSIPAAWLTGKILDIVSDVPLYLGVTGDEIRRVVKPVIQRHPNCVVVAHSLGSVIAADVLRQAQMDDNFASMPISGLITLGSPLNLLRMRNPMTGPFPFRWYNLYYPHDAVVIGNDLDPAIFPGVHNLALNISETPIVSHTSYWSSATVSDTVYQLSAGEEE